MGLTFLRSPFTVGGRGTVFGSKNRRRFYFPTPKAELTPISARISHPLIVGPIGACYDGPRCNSSHRQDLVLPDDVLRNRGNSAMRNNVWSMGTLVMLLGLVGVGPAEADLVTALDSSLALTAEAQCGFIPPPLVTDTDSQSQGSTTNPLNVSVQAVSTYPPDNASLVVTGSGSAIWTAPSQGQVAFTDIGWTSMRATGLAYLFSNTGWTYSFVSSVDGSFVIDYSVTAQGTSSTSPNPLIGLNEFLIYGGQGSVPPGNATLSTGLNATGTASLAINAGNTYTVEIQPYANLLGGIGTTDAHMDGTFDFYVQAVPEPSSLVMAATICPLCLGYWMRRRRRAAA